MVPAPGGPDYPRPAPPFLAYRDTYGRPATTSTPQATQPCTPPSIGPTQPPRRPSWSTIFSPIVSILFFFPFSLSFFLFSRIYLFIYLLQLSRLSSWENSPSPENRCRNYNDCIIRKKYTHIFEYKIHSTEFIYISQHRRKAFIFLVVTRRKRENSKIDRRWRDAWRGSRYTDGGRGPRGLGPRAL